MENLVQKWENTGLLIGLTEDKKKDLAVMFENQIKYNESDDLTPSFRRLSIPLLRRAFFDLKTTSESTDISKDKWLETVIELPASSGDAEKEAVMAREIAKSIKSHVTEVLTVKEIKNINGIGIKENRIVIYYN